MWFQFFVPKMISSDWVTIRIAVVSFPSVLHHFMLVLDWMRPPAPAAGPTKGFVPLLTTGLEPCYFTSPTLTWGILLSLIHI